MMNRNIIKAGLFFSLLVLLFPQTGFSADSYKKALKKWTRSDAVYSKDDMKALLVWTATLNNAAMIEAQADKYIETYESGDAQRENFISERMAKKGNNILFFISFYASERNFSDLKNPKGDWGLTLKVGGETYKPVKLEKISGPAALNYLFFPYLDRWSVAYYAWFPAAAIKTSGPLSLSVHGPLAHSELVWK